jgi:hypothetical protein
MFSGSVGELVGLPAGSPVHVTSTVTKITTTIIKTTTTIHTNHRDHEINVTFDVIFELLSSDDISETINKNQQNAQMLYIFSIYCNYIFRPLLTIVRVRCYSVQ